MLPQIRRLHIPLGSWPAALIALLGGPALWGIVARAEGPPARQVAAATAPAPVAPVAPVASVAPRAAAAPAAPVAPAVVDPAAVAAFTTFLRDYHQALGSGNRSFLAQHTVFPLPFAQAEYEMEGRVRPAKLAAVDKLLKLKKLLRWPQALVPRAPTDLNNLHRGTEQCSDPKAPDVPDYKSGPPAITVHGDQATLTYLAEPCAAETHVVTLTFARTGALWRLRERAVRLGTE